LRWNTYLHVIGEANHEDGRDIFRRKIISTGTRPGVSAIASSDSIAHVGPTSNVDSTSGDVGPVRSLRGHNEGGTGTMVAIYELLMLRLSAQRIGRGQRVGSVWIRVCV
jgi:hypothetical protein